MKCGKNRYSWVKDLCSVSVKMKSDGAIVTVSSQAAMVELRKGCR